MLVAAKTLMFSIFSNALCNLQYKHQSVFVNFICEEIINVCICIYFQLLNRMRDSAHCLTRLTMHRQKENQQAEALNNLQNYKKFVIWLTLFCFDNLKIGSNYSRRFISLKILTLSLVSIFSTGTSLRLPIFPHFTNKMLTSPHLLQDVLRSELLKADECQTQLWTNQNALLLLGVILVDTFDENKEMAANILLLFPHSILGLNVRND